MYIFYIFLPPMNIMDPSFLSHVVSKIFTSDPPPPRSRYHDFCIGLSNSKHRFLTSSFMFCKVDVDGRHATMIVNIFPNPFLIFGVH